jgi:hypothetical protein
MTGGGQPVVAYPPSAGEADGLSTTQLVSRLAEELSRLARDEFQLARRLDEACALAQRYRAQLATGVVTALVAAVAMQLRGRRRR